MAQAGEALMPTVTEPLASFGSLTGDKTPHFPGQQVIHFAYIPGLSLPLPTSSVSSGCKNCNENFG
jgi:hypothetical protein